MLEEIVSDYFNTTKKSIVNYVLKDNRERERLSLPLMFNAPPDYGSVAYEGIEPDNEWKKLAVNSALFIRDNTSIFSKANLELSMLWKDFENMLFVSMPQPDEAPAKTLFFIKRQEDQRTKVRTPLTENWARKPSKF